MWQIYTFQSNGNLTDSSFDSSYFIPTVRAHIGQNRWGRSTPNRMAISQNPSLTAHISFLLWELILHRPGVADLPLPSYGNFKDSFSDSTYFIPTVRTHIAQTRSLIYTLPSNGNFTDSCSDSSYFIPTLTTDIVQNKFWQMYPPIKQWLQTPTVRTHLWQPKCWYIFPP